MHDYCMHVDGDDFINTRNLTFTSGTGPFDRGSVMCIDISIVNDFLVEGTEKFVLCALDENNMPGDYSACTDIFIEDDDGIIVTTSTCMFTSGRQSDFVLFPSLHVIHSGGASVLTGKLQC